MPSQFAPLRRPPLLRARARTRPPPAHPLLPANAAVQC
jgi:hypothetical protein